MQKIYTTLIACCLILTGSAQNPNFEWAKATNGNNWDEANAITTDVDGNVYITGHFMETVDFDPGPNEKNLTAAGGLDIFIQKLDANGDFLWAYQLGGLSWDIGRAIATDKDGNLYTTGFFAGTVDFDPGPNEYNLVAGYYTGAAFIQKLDADGNFVWAHKIQGSYDTTPSDIAIDANNNVYTTGYFQGTADFDPGSGVEELSSVMSSPDIFIQKLDANGNFLWAKQMGGMIADEATSIAIAPDGGVYTTGYFNETVDFDPGPGIDTLTSAGASSIFIQKLDTNGDFLWAKKMVGNGWEQGSDIATDSYGNVYTTGFFTETVDFDPGPGIKEFTAENEIFNDIFIQKLDADGNFLWAKQMGGMYEDHGLSIATDDAGSVYTTGYFEGTADFDPGAGVQNLTSLDYLDIFIQKLDTNGEFRWVRQIGGEEYQGANAVTIDADKNIYTTGMFLGTVDFNTDADVLNFSSENGGIFIHKMKQSPSGIVENTFAHKFVFSPNPTSKYFNVEFERIQENLTVRLLSFSGQILEMDEFRNTHLIQLDINHPPGAYMLEITDAEGNKATIKLMKM